VHAAEKSLQEMGDRADGNTRSQVEQAVAALKQALAGEDRAEIKRLTDQLHQAIQLMSQVVYGQTRAGSAQDHGKRPFDRAGQSARESNEDVVDADFEEVA
jgi:molecular chaperone DnaK